MIELRSSIGLGGLLVVFSGCVAAPKPAPTTAMAPEPSPPRVSVGAPVAGRCLSPTQISADFYGEGDMPSAACRQQAKALVARMTVAEKVGQMLQAGHDQVRQSPGDVAQRFIGSVLSGGGQGPGDPTALEWAKLVNGYRIESLKTRLRIPILYGIDAVHGHNSVRGAVIFPHNIGLGA